MYNHEPAHYRCPFCLTAQGVEDDSLDTKQADVIYHDNEITAFISSNWWPNNKGHVMIVPNQHFENLYDIPDELLSAIHIFSKKVAKALKATYNCDGVSVRQHNEPAGDQEVWHYHLHVFPRHKGDELYKNHDLKKLSDPKERLVFAKKLRDYLAG